jgi:hypothetical protein
MVQNDFMSWTSESVMRHGKGRGKVPMQVQMTGTSWKLRAVEIYDCKMWLVILFLGSDILAAKTRTGRCSEWSMLFGGIMNAESTRIVMTSLTIVGMRL